MPIGVLSSYGGDCVSENTVSDSDFYLLLKFYEKSILLIFSFLISYFFFCFFLFCFEVLPYFCTGIGKKDK